MDTSRKGNDEYERRNEQYLDKYSDEIREMFMEIRKTVVEAGLDRVEERMWAKLPSYYVNERFVRVIPFKDHINIEASTLVQFANDLTQYKITPKGMLQIYTNQQIPKEILALVFKDTFLG